MYSMIRKDKTTGYGVKLITTTSTSLFTFVFAKFANFVEVRPTTTMFIIQDKRRRRWPNLGKVGKFGKH